MAAFDVWDVVKLPFPSTDRPVRQRRPALVISAGDLLETAGLIWVAMITSAENRGWAGDVEIRGDDSGLPAESIVRTAKIACIDAKDAVRMGSVGTGEIRARIVAGIRARLAMLLRDAPAA
jgi:mRNA interferase MazF